MRVRAKEKYYYSLHRREYAPGEEFEFDARASDFNLLCVLGKIEPVSGPAPQAQQQPAPAYATKVAEPESEPAQPQDTENSEALVQPSSGKRFYRRRDMRPKE